MGTWSARFGMAAGPAAGIIVYGLTGGDTAELSAAGRATAAVAAWMACWWLTEALPLAATALLPVAVFPLLGIATLDATVAPYARPLIFLFLGGFLLGLAIQRCGLHQRIALVVVWLVGTQPARLVAGFMLASAFLSMWISNTATAIMMLPIAASVLGHLHGETPASSSPGTGNQRRDSGTATPFDLGPALMLGIAYAASIGGAMTLVGTPPNLVLASFAREQLAADLTMLGWLGIGLPVAAVMLPLTWLYLTRLAFRVRAQGAPISRAFIGEQLRALGPMSRGERHVLAGFVLTAGAWVLRPWLVAVSGWDGLSDPLIAMTAAIALFLVPVGPIPGRRALDGESLRHVPWDVLLIFGGGLTLASAVTANGVDIWLASGFSRLGGAHELLILATVTLTVVLLTEITSNTAVTTTALPVLSAGAAAMGLPPGPLLTAAALSASCAFMLPVATPPNAIVYASKHVSLRQMVRAGAGLNIIAVLTIAGLVHLLGSPLG